MKLLEAIIFGIIQGLTEFLPVSSSGHLALAQAFFGSGLGEDSLAFSVLLHLGTLVAVFAVYRKEIAELISAFFSVSVKLFRGKFRFSELDNGERTLLYLIIASLPLIPAALLEDRIAFISTKVTAVGALLILNSIVLLAADRRSCEKLTPDKVSPSHALLVGISQIFALFPGLSRSGTTVSAGLSLGFERQYAVKFSFLLSIPAVIGACALDLPDFISRSAESDPRQLLIYLAGAAFAAVTGVCAIKLITFLSKKGGFTGFALYTAALGSAAAVFGLLADK